MEIYDVLLKIGLNEKQQKLYLAALESGRSTITSLAKKSNLKRSTTYNIVSDLEQKGLLSNVKVKKRTYYIAANPKQLLNLAKSIQDEMDQVLPELMAIYNKPKNKPKIQIFEGAEGIKLIYKELYELLSCKQEALWLTRIDAIRIHFPESIKYYKQLLRKLKNPKIRELNSGNKEGLSWLQEIKPYQGKNHFLRTIPAEFEFGFCDNMIFGNKIAIFSLKNDPFVIVIESEEIAKTHRALFDFAWQSGKTLQST